MHEAVAAIASCGVSPIVRIPDNQGWMVKRALDAGAHGVLVPLLYTVEDARKLVQSAKFPPLGARGFGSPFSMGMFDVKGGLSQSDYLKQANEGLLTVVQIETKEALENVSAPLHSLLRSQCFWRRLRWLADGLLAYETRSRPLPRWMGLMCFSSGHTIWGTTSVTQ